MFKSKILDFDRRLGTVLCEAFFNCNGLEAAFKVSSEEVIKKKVLVMNNVWRRKWQPTPVFLPRESREWRNLVGYSPCGRKESDTTE